LQYILIKMNDSEKNKINSILGYNGKLISMSKTLYRNKYPDNLVIFNSNICTKEDGKIWYGDIDITISKNELIELSKKLNKTIYILYEMDGRFENENNPLIDNNIIHFNPDGTHAIGEKYKEYYIFD
jgi:hypothetical protein